LSFARKNQLSRDVTKPSDQLRLRLQGELIPNPSLIDGIDLHGEDLYSVFAATAVYLAFEHDAFGLWGMNYAELSYFDSSTNAEFQVTPNDNTSAHVIPQFCKCAELSLAHFGDFRLDTVELFLSPGSAGVMESRLCASLNRYRVYVPTQSCRTFFRIHWLSDAVDEKSSFETISTMLSDSTFKLDMEDPFKLELEDKPISCPNDDYSPNDDHSTLKRFNAAGTALLPERSLDCAGWIIAYLISLLAPIKTEDISVRLEFGRPEGFSD